MSRQRLVQAWGLVMCEIATCCREGVSCLHRDCPRKESSGTFLTTDHEDDTDFSGWILMSPGAFWKEMRGASVANHLAESPIWSDASYSMASSRLGAPIGVRPLDRAAGE